MLPGFLLTPPVDSRCPSHPSALVTYPPARPHLPPEPPSSGLLSLTLSLRKASVLFLGSLHSGNLVAPGRDVFWDQGNDGVGVGCLFSALGTGVAHDP